MKIPAVAIAVAFACGIALGLSPPIARHARSPLLLIVGFTVALGILIAALALVTRTRVVIAAVLASAGWVVLGITAAWIGEQARSVDHVISLVEAGRLELRNPLRWHGRLKDEPQRLPWGYGLELDLNGVEYRGTTMIAHGGLRLSFSPHFGDPGLPQLHAGDEVAAVAQAKQPQMFRDEGAFDRRAYLASQNVDLIGTLRAAELITRESAGQITVNTVIARVRRRLRDEIDTLFPAQPEVAAVLRAMLLGDRTFVDRDIATTFQKTGVFHVIVVAGLHVGALATLLFWLGRKLRLSIGTTILLTLSVLAAYVAVVEQRPPVLRAALMAAIVVLARIFYRRLEILNSAGGAALILLIARPLALKDSSFQLSFLAIGCIAALALPWLENTFQPYVRALRGWRDVARDAAHPPLVAQFRIDLRSALAWIANRTATPIRQPVQNAVVRGLSAGFRIWELLVVTTVLQIGMLPLMARDFHRVALTAPLVNLLAVPVTSIVVPLGFVTLASAVLINTVGKILASVLGWLTLLLLRVVERFAALPRWSYRVPTPNTWLIVVFFVLAVMLAVTLRFEFAWRRRTILTVCACLAGTAFLIAVFPFPPKWSAGKLELTVLDVGQGDSLFVVSPAGRTMLIDGGGAFGHFPGQRVIAGLDPGEEAVSPYLWSRGFQSLDIVALTHAHEDHIGGLFAILENFHVNELWIGREASSPTLSRLEQLARLRRISIKHPRRGETFFWDGVLGRWLWPDASAPNADHAPKNDDSLVLSLRYGSRSVLLPGDAEKDAERTILEEERTSALQADVLKVGHHGSRNSTTLDFLTAVEPRVAIVSAGEENPYGHPSPELLQRLEDQHARVLRTDLDGAVHVLTDGERFDIACFVPCGAASVGTSSRAQAPNRGQNNHQ